ncbi:MAG: T9SS type A sorting domain-containing protein [Ignavibacteriales bacterium]|nr:MAG: T9SS type A sorting domain-containing protein [Ignavibacteriales bacterium]
MLRKLSILVLVVLLVPVVLVAQTNNKKFTPKAPIVFQEPTTVSTDNLVGPGFSTASANYTAVDTMANAFGPAISTINPLAYDPRADVVAMVHRGKSTYALGSGQLWYSFSTDRGATWNVRQGPVNTDPILARYPSMAISNPTSGGLDATTGFFSWPELNPGAFGNIGYGAEQPIGSNAAFSDTIVGSYSSQVPCWASHNSAWMFWTSDNQVDAGIDIWRTQDFATIEKATIPSAAFVDGSNITLGGASFNGVDVLAVLGTYADPDPGNPIQFGWYPGIFKSTDNGATWSNPEVVDFRTIPALSAFDQLFDYDPTAGTIRFDGDVHMDANGHVHLLLGVTDTNAVVDAIVDIFETGSGWDATIVDQGGFDIAPYALGPGLGQMGYSCYLSFNEARNVMAAQWTKIDGGEWCDVYFAYKGLDADTWSTPQNLTESPSQNNTQNHFAPFLYDDGSDNYTAFSMYGYVAGATGPYGDTTTATVYYIAPVPFTGVGVGDGQNVVNSFKLDQNYPNPFNPSTSITYSIAERSNVSIKVYDVLGKEVATLINTTQDAGEHSINFDASNLASGLYIYTLKSGNFTSSKKMMLLK